MTEASTAASPNAHWKRRRKTNPIPADQAKRQGEITTTAFLLLGRESAIAFLNAAHPELGGRPIDVATSSDVGRNQVEAVIGRMAYRQV